MLKAIMDLLFLLLALALVFLNGFFVATEFAIVKVRPTRIEELIRQKKPGAMAAQGLIANLDAYLSATQLGITIASLGLGWLGKPAFAKFIAGPLLFMGISDPAWIESISAALAFGLISFLHIVVGELAPKSLALINAEGVAIFAAYPMRFFYLIFFPFIWSLNGLSNALLRCFGLHHPTAGDGGEGHSEEELKIILSQARSAGLLSVQREEILRKALILPNKTARHLMIPRNDVIYLDVNLSIETNLERALQSGHKRFPLCDRELDDVLGIVDLRQLFFDSRDKHITDLRPLAKPITYFPEMISGERLLAEFRTRHTGMAIIVDEYGGTSGILTAGDLVSAVMGLLEDSDDPDMVRLPGGAYDVEGVAPLEEIEETLKIEFPNNEDMRTIAGFLMEKLGRMPKNGDRINICGYSFHVLDVSGPRVNKIRIQQEKREPRPLTPVNEASPAGSPRGHQPPVKSP